MRLGVVAGAGLCLCLAGCATVPRPQPGLQDAKAQARRLLALGAWAFDGRLAVATPDDAWTAAISWRHTPAGERIRLAGPLGQGGALIELAPGLVRVDRGGGDVRSSDDPDGFVSQQLGMDVPLRSLGYWVLGLARPGQPSQPMTGGFLQGGWYVDYREMQPVGGLSMPRKMAVMNDRVKLKLHIDQWRLDDAATR